MFFKRNKKLQQKVGELESRVDSLSRKLSEEQEKNRLYTGQFGRPLHVAKAVQLLADKAGVSFEWQPSTGPDFVLKEKGGNAR